MGSARLRMRARIYRSASIFLLGLLLLCPVGGRGQEPATAKSSATLRADDWFTVNKDYSSQRYVDLDQITPQNVGGLKEICEVDLNEPSWFSSGILKIGRTLYVTTRRMTYAIDAETCKLRWRYVIHDIVNPDNFGSGNNRGAAYLDGRLFRGTADGRMLALDARTGEFLWENKDADQNANESFIAAPVAWDGKVFSGIATADAGVRGRVMGFDAKTGKELWRFYTVPAPMPVPPNPPGTPNYSGGAFWTSFSLDPTTGEVFAPVSNPFPDFTGDVRLGDNLYTNALLSLNADGGSLEFGAGLNWYYQAVQHDIHDWDLGTAPTLYRNRDGKNIASIAGKDGNVYLIDRATHMPIVWPPTPGTTQENVNAPFPANPEFPAVPPTAAVRVCPGAVGGFTGTAYSPQLDALYVGMPDWCYFFFTVPAANGLMDGTDAPDYSLGTPPQGWITAIDGNDGHVLWQYHAAAQVLAGPVTTKSGILFDGDTLGNLLALDAKTGSVLKSIDVKGALNSGLISYAVDGVQYLAAEVGGLSLNSAGITRPLRVGGPLRVKIFGLTGTDNPKIVKLDRVPQDGKTPERMGSNLYHGVCLGCHGFKGTGFGFPPITNQFHILTDAQRLKAFFESVSPPMPKLYPGLLTDDDVELLAGYFKTLNFPFQPGYTRPTSGGTAGWPEIYSVLTHPRCINCHTLSPAGLPSTDYRFPRQADDRHPHLFNVVAGSTNMAPLGDTGDAIARCSNCHGFQNNAFTGAPGAGNPDEPWQLAPLSMAWESSPNVAMTGNQLCTVLQNLSMNGGKNLTALLKHVTTDPLVLWGFSPGVRLDGQPRETPPLSHQEFVATFTTWANAGGPCPAP